MLDLSFVACTGLMLQLKRSEMYMDTCVDQNTFIRFVFIWSFNPSAYCISAMHFALEAKSETSQETRTAFSPRLVFSMQET